MPRGGEATVGASPRQGDERLRGPARGRAAATAAVGGGADEARGGPDGGAAGASEILLRECVMRDVCLQKPLLVLQLRAASGRRFVLPPAGSPVLFAAGCPLGLGCGGNR